jgi:hypothetical protein
MDGACPILDHQSSCCKSVLTDWSNLGKHATENSYLTSYTFHSLLIGENLIIDEEVMTSEHNTHAKKFQNNDAAISFHNAIIVVHTSTSTYKRP